MNSKKGSTSIFLIFILTAMTALTACFIYAAKQAAIFSYCDGVLNLSGKSVLSEFNLALKQDYGIFAFESSGGDMKKDLAEYTGYALQQNSDAKIGNVLVETGEYSLGNINVLKEQILEHMKFAIANNLFQLKDHEKALKKERTDRTLRNRKIIDTLPSSALAGSHVRFSEWAENTASRLDSVEQIFNETSENFLINRYIIETFKHALGGPQDRNTFFENEVEYILEGNYSNKKNHEGVRKGLVLMRSVLNAAYLYLDSEKRNITMAAAELLTPGPAAAVTQAVLVGTWALAEAENDAELLQHGKPVALFKNRESWATDLDSVIKGSVRGPVDTGCKKGLYYKDYLMIFLSVQNEVVKMSRVMDLIQINMKGNYNGDFLIRWCSCGFQLRAEINGRERVYDFKY